MSESSSAPTEGDVVTIPTAGSVDEAVEKLTELVHGRGMTLFTVIDHSGEARRSGLDLPDTKVVIFGSPIAGTPIMAAAPLAALDLPLRVLVWDQDGQTMVSYTDPAALAARHHLSAELAGRIAGIRGLVDAMVS